MSPSSSMYFSSQVLSARLESGEPFRAAPRREGLPALDAGIVEGELAVESGETPVLEPGQGIDLQQLGVVVAVRPVERDEGVRDRRLVGAEPEAVEHRARGVGVESARDVHRSTPQSFGHRGRNLLDIHSAFGGEHDQRPLRCRVVQDRRVVLGRDRGPLLDEHGLDAMPRDLHAEDRVRRLRRLLGRVRGPDPAGLAPLARGHLGLDHHRSPELLRPRLRLPGAPSQAAARNRDARRRQQGLGGMFFEVHGIRCPVIGNSVQLPEWSHGWRGMQERGPARPVPRVLRVEAHSSPEPARWYQPMAERDPVPRRPRTPCDGFRSRRSCPPPSRLPRHRGKTNPDLHSESDGTRFRIRRLCIPN